MDRVNRDSSYKSTRFQNVGANSTATDVVVLAEKTAEKIRLLKGNLVKEKESLKKLQGLERHLKVTLEQAPKDECKGQAPAKTSQMYNLAELRFGIQVSEKNIRELHYKIAALNLKRKEALEIALENNLKIMKKAKRKFKALLQKSVTEQELYRVVDDYLRFVSEGVIAVHYNMEVIREFEVSSSVDLIMDKWSLFLKDLVRLKKSLEKQHDRLLFRVHTKKKLFKFQEKARAILAGVRFESKMCMHRLLALHVELENALQEEDRERVRRVVDKKLLLVRAKFPQMKNSLRRLDRFTELLVAKRELLSPYPRLQAMCLKTLRVAVRARRLLEAKRIELHNIYMKMKEVFSV